MMTRAVRKVLMIEDHARTLVAVFVFFLIKFISVVFFCLLGWYVWRGKRGLGGVALYFSACFLADWHASVGGRGEIRY